MKHDSLLGVKPPNESKKQTGENGMQGGGNKP